MVHSIARIFCEDPATSSLPPAEAASERGGLGVVVGPAGCRWGLRLPARSRPVCGDPHWIGKLLGVGRGIPAANVKWEEAGFPREAMPCRSGPRNSAVLGRAGCRVLIPRTSPSADRDTRSCLRVAQASPQDGTASSPRSDSQGLFLPCVWRSRP